MEYEILKFQRELVEIKQDLKNKAPQPQLNDTDSYRIATKIDLTVSRLIRILECKYDQS